MITKNKITEMFCIIDEFDRNLNVELSKKLCLLPYWKSHTNLTHPVKVF